MKWLEIANIRSEDGRGGTTMMERGMSANSSLHSKRNHPFGAAAQMVMLEETEVDRNTESS